MSYTFTKLFSSITSSTVWMEPSGTRLTWIAMLANCDRKGRVFASMPGLAHLARVTLEEAEIAIRTFLAPDPYSRTPDNEGRRIVEIDGGWQLLNHEKYRGIRDEETIREAKADYMRRKRAEEKSGTDGSTNSTVERGGSKQKQIQKQKQGSGSNEPDGASRAKPLEVPDGLKAAWDRWNKYRNGTKGWTADGKALNLSTMGKLAGNDGAMAMRIVEQSIERGWTGLFPLKDQPATTAAQPRAKSSREALAPSEKPLERDLAYARQRYERGEFGETGTVAASDAFAEERARITAKHRAKT